MYYADGVQFLIVSTTRRERMLKDKKWWAARIKHGGYLGGTESAEHYIWRSMIARCKNKDPFYETVRVCKRWKKFENFLTDMGMRPTVQHQIDRYPDPFGNYEASNCRWATRSEQQKNRRTTKRWTDGRFSGTLVECAEYLEISKALAHWRMKKWRTFQKEVPWVMVQNTR
jgi:hypothetical protein